MSFFHKKMSQNLWATIMPFGRVTLIFYWPKNFFSGQPQAGPHFRHCSMYKDNDRQWSKTRGIVYNHTHGFTLFIRNRYTYCYDKLL